MIFVQRWLLRLCKTRKKWKPCNIVQNTDLFKLFVVESLWWLVVVGFYNVVTLPIVARGNGRSRTTEPRRRLLRRGARAPRQEVLAPGAVVPATWARARVVPDQPVGHGVPVLLLLHRRRPVLPPFPMAILVFSDQFVALPASTAVILLIVHPADIPAFTCSTIDLTLLSNYNLFQIAKLFLYIKHCLEIVEGSNPDGSGL